MSEPMVVLALPPVAFVAMFTAVVLDVRACVPMLIVVLPLAIAVRPMLIVSAPPVPFVAMFTVFVEMLFVVPVAILTVDELDDRPKVTDDAPLELPINTVPVKVGLSLNTTEPVPMLVSTPVPPFNTGKIPVAPDDKSNAPPRVKSPDDVTVPLNEMPLIVPVPLTLVTEPLPLLLKVFQSVLDKKPLVEVFAWAILIAGVVPPDDVIGAVPVTLVIVPCGVVIEPPRLTVVLLIVMLELVKLEFSMLLNVFVEPEIDLLVSLCVPSNVATVLSIAIVPDDVIVPPDKPVPAVILVTVPLPLVTQVVS